MAGPVNFVLPQYQGDVLDAQRKMMIAQALQQNAMTPTQEPGWNQMPVVPAMGIAPVISQLGQALLANKAMKGAINAQRNVGMEQWQAMRGMFSRQQPNSQQGQGGVSSAPGAQPMAQGGVSNASAPQGGGPLNPLGMDPDAATLGYYADPAGYMKDAVYGPLAQRMAPTDYMKNLAASGVDPNSSLGHQLMQDFLAKQNYIAPTSLRGGGYMYNPKTGGLENLPNDVPGFQNVKNPQTGQWQAVPIQGALGAIGQSEAAKAGGKAQYQLAQGFDANGNPITTTVANQANAAMGGGMGMGAGGALPSQLPAGSPDLAKDYVDQYTNVRKSASNAPADIQAFKAIDQAAQGAKTGVAFDRTAYLKSLASVIPGISPNSSDKEAADIITKYANQIASRNGGRSDAALETALHSITNTGMSPAAIRELTPSLIGLRQADMSNASAAQKWLEAHGNNPLSLGKYQDAWNKSYDPDIFRFQAMDPQQRAQFKAGMSKDQQEAFRSKIMQLQQLGAL